jgi:hypothetical protein
MVMKQYELAIQALKEAIERLRESHIFPQDLSYIESSLRVDIMFLESRDKQRLEEAKKISESLGIAIGNEARVTTTPLSLNTPELASPGSLSGEASNSQPKDTVSCTLLKPTMTSRADTSIQSRRKKQLKELTHER